LIVAEIGESFLNKMLKYLLGVCAGDGVMEGLEVAEVFGEFAGDGHRVLRW
jgi:hypothetical protein